jgi:very-short-patch-repair endonuclease
VVDFFCPSSRLIVEVDGGQHDQSMPHERERTRFLESSGYRVLRYWNNEVLGNIEGVLAAIECALVGGGPPTQPSPSRGEG